MKTLYKAVTVVGASAVLILAAACEGPAEPHSPSWLKAVVHTDPTTTINGAGTFHVGRAPRYGADVKFSVAASDNAEGRKEHILLTRPGKGRPPEGTYELGLLQAEDQSLVGFRALYLFWSESEGSRYYTSTSGRVRITHSSDERVEGEFRFTGRLYCESEPREVWRGYECDPQVPLNGFEPLVVEGSFSLAPPEPGEVRPDVERPGSP